MAARVIGLDVGTNAVRAVEVELGDPPAICRMGQVGLPVGAVVDGEVIDAAAVSLALRRLWAEVGFKDKKVRVGMSSARVIVRAIEMPRLSHDELMSTIRLQLDDFVPLPPDETVFDIRTIEGPDTSNKTQQLLLAATHFDAVEPLVMALNGADLKVAAVDVIPAALAAAFTRPDPEQDDGVDVVLSIGAGTVVVVAARDGEALYSRTVTNVGGRRMTERLANQLAMSEHDAERAKRLEDDVESAFGSTMLNAAPNVDELIGEVRASLSFYAEQSSARPVRRLLVTGGGSLLLGLTSALSDELDLEVEAADPFAHVRLGAHAGFDQSDLPYLAPYMGAALGVALRGGRPKDRRIDLSPVASGSSHTLISRRALARVGAVVLVGAAGAYYMHGRSAITDEQTALTAAQVQLAGLQVRVADAPAAAGPVVSTGGASPAAVAASVAPGDIDWLAVEGAVSGGSTPLGVNISSFQGVVEPPPIGVIVDPSVVDTEVAAVDPVAAQAALPLARLTLTATAPGLVAVADWLDSLATDPRFADPWASGLTVITLPDGSTSVQLTMAMTLTAENLVDRTVAEEVAG